MMIIAIPVVKAGDRYYLSPHFGRAPYFAIIEVENSRYRFREVVENPHIDHERGKGAAVANLLISRDVNAVIALSIGYRLFVRLKEHGVKIYLIPENIRGLVSLEAAVEMLINGKLEEAEKPQEYQKQAEPDHLNS